MLTKLSLKHKIHIDLYINKTHHVETIYNLQALSCL